MGDCSHLAGEQRYSTHRKVTVQMVTKVEHLGSTPACQPQEIKEVALQVMRAQSEMWVQATSPHAGVNRLMGCQPALCPTIYTQRFLSFPTSLHFLAM